MDICQMNR